MFPRDDSNPLIPLIGDDLAVDKMGYEAGLRFIRANPLMALLLIPAKLFYLFNSNDFGVHWNRLSAVSLNQAGTGAMAFALTDLVYVIDAILALIGVASAVLNQRTKSSSWSMIFFGAYWTTIHLPYFGQDRFVLPLLPILVIFAARGVQTLIR